MNFIGFSLVFLDDEARSAYPDFVHVGSTSRLALPTCADGSLLALPSDTLADRFVVKDGILVNSDPAIGVCPLRFAALPLVGASSSLARWLFFPN